MSASRLPAYPPNRQTQRDPPPRRIFRQTEISPSRRSHAFSGSGYRRRLGASGLPARGAAEAGDEEYGKKIKEYLQDPRITTELVDHLPASSTVPTPLKFHGRIVGTPNGHLRPRHPPSSRRSRSRAEPGPYWSIGKTGRGRDMVVLAIADEEDHEGARQVQRRWSGATDPRKDEAAEAEHSSRPQSRCTG